MNKIKDIEKLLEKASIAELLGKKEEPKKKCHCLAWIFAILGILLVVGAVAYVLYMRFAPCYEDMDDFDDFDDDDDEDIFVDESDPEEN